MHPVISVTMHAGVAPLGARDRGEAQSPGETACLLVAERSLVSAHRAEIGASQVQPCSFTVHRK